MTIPGYDFARADLAELLLRKFFPERTDRESGIIRDFLLARGGEFDRWSFSVRVGEGVKPDPTHLQEIQANTARFSKKRIDMIAWQGDQAFIIEVKERVSPAVLGQLQTYRHLWLEENPDAKEPKLVAIGRYSDADTLRALNAHGIDVILYEVSQG